MQRGDSQLAFQLIEKSLAIFRKLRSGRVLSNCSRLGSSRCSADYDGPRYCPLKCSPLRELGGCGEAQRVWSPSACTVLGRSPPGRADTRLLICGSCDMRHGQQAAAACLDGFAGIALFHGQPTGGAAPRSCRTLRDSSDQSRMVGRSGNSLADGIERNAAAVARRGRGSVFAASARDAPSR